MRSSTILLRLRLALAGVPLLAFTPGCDPDAGISERSIDGEDAEDGCDHGPHDGEHHGGEHHGDKPHHGHKPGHGDKPPGDKPGCGCDHEPPPPPPPMDGETCSKPGDEPPPPPEASTGDDTTGDDTTGDASTGDASTGDTDTRLPDPQ